MEILGIIPADSIKFNFGLFCSGNFIFGDKERAELSETYGFKWDDVKKLNIKENFQVHLKSGDIIGIDLDNLEFMRRYACKYCSDYSAEFADISFGGVGAEEGWTTVITRTPLGRAVFANAKESVLEEFKASEKSDFATYAHSKTRNASSAKKNRARKYLKELGGSGISVIS
jgi:coenzyme F420 hydrogenase subunit beta